MDFSSLLIMCGVLCGVFFWGCCSLMFRVWQLQNDNRMLRDLLGTVLRLEQLSSQTYSKITREFTAANAQKPMHKSKSSP